VEKILLETIHGELKQTLEQMNIATDCECVTVLLSDCGTITLCYSLTVLLCDCECVTV